MYVKLSAAGERQTTGVLGANEEKVECERTLLLVVAACVELAFPSSFLVGASEAAAAAAAAVTWATRDCLGGFALLDGRFAVGGGCV